jgi:putative transposase
VNALAPVPAPRSSALRKGRVSIRGQVYHVTARCLPGTSPFADFSSACFASRAFLLAAARSEVVLLAWVLMPDHAHWLIEVGAAANLSKAVAALKRDSASAVNAVNGSGRGVSLWQSGFHDRAVRSDENLTAVARYVVANPLRARLVDRIGDYPFWNAVWL